MDNSTNWMEYMELGDTLPDMLDGSLMQAQKSPHNEDKAMVDGDSLVFMMDDFVDEKLDKLRSNNIGISSPSEQRLGTNAFLGVEPMALFSPLNTAGLTYENHVASSYQPSASLNPSFLLGVPNGETMPSFGYPPTSLLSTSAPPANPINIPSHSHSHGFKQHPYTAAHSVQGTTGLSFNRSSSNSFQPSNSSGNNSALQPSSLKTGLLHPTSAFVSPNEINPGNLSPPSPTTPLSPSYGVFSPSIITSNARPGLDGMFECICGKKYGTMQALKNHAKLHGPRERNFICQTCKKGFLRRQDLKRHETTHLEDYHPYSCDNCGTTFTRSDALARHVKARRCFKD